MHPAVAVALGVALGLFIISRPGVKAMVGGYMLPAGPCVGCKGG